MEPLDKKINQHSLNQKHQGCTFGKEKKLTTNEQFTATISTGRRAANSLLTLFVAKNNCGHPRIGISIRKSSGKAVVRNRLKRLIRESFRQSQNSIPADLDYVVMISPNWLKKYSISTLKAQMVTDSFLALVQKLTVRKDKTMENH